MKISEAQRKVIDYIEQNLGVMFIGITSKDAQDFISRYIDISKNVYDKYREVGLCDEEGRMLYLDDIVTYNNNEYSIKYECGAYVLVKESEVNMYAEFVDCWNDDVYPLIQLYWTTNSEESYINGLIKVNVNDKTK